MSELTRRVLVGVIAAPLVVLVIFAGGAALAALLAIVSALAAWEFFRIARGCSGGAAWPGAPASSGGSAPSVYAWVRGRPGGGGSAESVSSGSA